MSKNTGKVKILGGLFAFLTAVSAPIAVNAGNWWAGSERSGSCYIPNMQTNFRCEFGSYTTVSGARQIGGFYVNPTNNIGHIGSIPLEYQINNDQAWRKAGITMNTTNGNYINFGNGVRSFKFRFPRPENSPLRVGGGTIKFTFNYDLDR